MKFWLNQLAIASDQWINAFLYGWADESLSARCWRLRDNYPYKALQPVIDGLFFWQDNHCMNAFISECVRKQSPPEER